MARTRIRYAEAPPRNDVYVGMLLVTVLMLAIGSALLALECNEYEWVDTPPPTATIALPTLPRPSGLSPATPPDGVPPAPPMNPGTTSQVPPEVIPEPPAAPAVATTTTKSSTAAPEVKPPAAPPALLPASNPDPNRPPRPGFNPSLPRR